MGEHKLLDTVRRISKKVKKTCLLLQRKGTPPRVDQLDIRVTGSLASRTEYRNSSGSEQGPGEDPDDGSDEEFEHII